MQQHTYALDMSWGAVLAQLGVRTADVLRRAQLPEDLFARSTARLESEAYYRLWRALEEALPGSPLPLQLFAALRSEAFSPPLFAALCSTNLRVAIDRLAKFKLLVAPMRLSVIDTRETFTVRATWLEHGIVVPPTLVLAELLFFVVLARMGTHAAIAPLSLSMPAPPSERGAYEAFLGASIEARAECAVTFRASDADRPFLSTNDAMWAVFEPELRRRLSALDADASAAQRVRSALLDGLPSGALSIESVARRLGISKRTLQRRLEDEGTSYQDVLRETRVALAMHYLEQTRLPTAEISFLLGFEESNSFYRAFHEWTGRTPELVRRGAQRASS